MTQGVVSTTIPIVVKLMRSKMYENQKTLLSIASLILYVFGFLLGAAENIPIVLRITSPDYVAARHGLDLLQSRKAIQDEDNIGLKQIAQIFLAELSLQNPPETVKSVTIKGFQLEGSSGIVFGAVSVNESVPVIVSLSNGQKVRWELPAIKAKVENLKIQNLFFWGVLLFCAGLIMQILAIFANKHGKEFAGSRRRSKK